MVATLVGFSKCFWVQSWPHCEDQKWKTHVWLLRKFQYYRTKRR